MIGRDYPLKLMCYTSNIAWSDIHSLDTVSRS